MVTLYHGSLHSMVPDNNRWGIYLTPSIDVANMYVVSQGDNMTGSYGHIYSVEIDENDIVFTNDIDQLAKSDKVLYCIDDEYYRIDYPETYAFKEITDELI